MDKAATQPQQGSEEPRPAQAEGGAGRPSRQPVQGHDRPKEPAQQGGAGRIRDWAAF